MKILHTGDLHFDNPPQLLAEIVKCSNHLIGVAIGEQPDLIAVAGDTFHDSVELGSPASLAAMKFIQQCADIAPVVVVRGTTTHDAEGSVNALAKLKGKNSIFVTDKPEQVYLLDSGQFVTNLATYDKPVALLSLLPSVTKANVVNGNGNGNQSTQRSNEQTADLLRDILVAWGEVNQSIRLSRGSTSGIPAIMVGHLTVTGSVLPTGHQMIGKELELTVGDLRLAGANLVCLGHIHKSQSWREISYCGSITRLNYGDAGDHKGFYIHELSKQELTSRFIETPARVMRVVKPMNDIPSTDDLGDIAAGDCVKLSFEISEEDLAKVNEEAIRQAALAKGAAEIKIEKIVVPKITVRAEGISRLKNAEDKLRKWAELTGVEVNENMLKKLSDLETINDPADYAKQYTEATT
ncbi:MAG: metallophosphoesterase [Proteobacteria bacterium]|nr:metallophosphoesterase [Pseudomonadota bacterium]